MCGSTTANTDGSDWLGSVGSFQSSCANAIGGFQSEGNTAHVYTWRGYEGT
eukprot:SAG31_NODE_23562_length_501_cov_2.405473_1_plen_50_part_10